MPSDLARATKRRKATPVDAVPAVEPAVGSGALEGSGATSGAPTPDDVQRHIGDLLLRLIERRLLGWDACDRRSGKKATI